MFDSGGTNWSDIANTIVKGAVSITGTVTASKEKQVGMKEATKNHGINTTIILTVIICAAVLLTTIIKSKKNG